MMNPQRIIALAAEPHINFQPGLIVLFLSETQLLVWRHLLPQQAAVSCNNSKKKQKKKPTEHQTAGGQNQQLAGQEHLAAKKAKYFCHELLETETRAEGEQMLDGWLQNERKGCRISAVC